MAALRTEKPVLRSPSGANPSITITNGSKSSHNLLTNSPSSGFSVNNNNNTSTNSTNLAAELAAATSGSATGGFALASALAGILGLTFPAPTLLTTNSNTINLNHKNTHPNSNSNTNSGISLTHVSNWLSASNPDQLDSVDPAVPNLCKSPETVSSLTSIPPEHFSVPLATSIFPQIDSNMLSFPFPLPAQQTCSDVSSDTGSAQSPFTPQQTGTSSVTGHATETHQSGVSLKFGSDSFNFESTSPFMTAAERDRKQREFIPESKKDDKYWERRRKNNEAAKRSREKRRQNDIMMECRINELNAQNQKLRQELIELKLRFEVPLNDDERHARDNLYISSPAVFNNNNGMSDSEYNNNKMSDTMSHSESGTPRPKSDSLDHVRNGSKHQSVSPFLSVNGGTMGDSVLRLSEATVTTPAAVLISTGTGERNGSLPPQLLPANFLSPQLNNINNTDLSAVKRIFSNLVAATGAVASATGVTSPNPPNPISTTILANPLLDNTSTAGLTGLNLNSSNCAVSVALLLQQAGLLPQSNPLAEAQKLFGLQDPSPAPDLVSSSSSSSSVTVSLVPTTVTVATVTPAASIPPKLALVSPTQSETMTWSDGTDSPLDLSLCLRVKSNTNTIDSQLSDSPSNYEPQLLDKRYQDRRRRNNEAVRRCRENKRARLLGTNGTNCPGTGSANVTNFVSSAGGGGGDTGSASSHHSGNSCPGTADFEPGEKLETENRALRNEVRALRKLLLVGPPNGSDSSSNSSNHNNNCDQASSESPTSESHLVSTTQGLDEPMMDPDQKMEAKTMTTTMTVLTISTSCGSLSNEPKGNRTLRSPNCSSTVDICSNQSSPQPLSECTSESPSNNQYNDVMEHENRVSDSSNTITPIKSGEAISCTGEDGVESESGLDQLYSTSKLESGEDLETDLRPATLNGPRLGSVRGRRRLSTKCMASRIPLSRHSADVSVPSTTLTGPYFHTHDYSQNSGKEDGVVS